MKKAIMIFGAGINQLELILEAKKLNITTIAIDPSFDPPGKKIVDFFYQVEGKDYESTKAIAIKHSINGIVTGQMEKPMRLMAKLASDLGLIFHSPEVVEKSLDKWLMKIAFQEKAVPCAKAKLFKPSDILTHESLDMFTFPIIIKPKDAFSSRGVYKINTYNEIAGYLDETRSFASTGDILIEEFLEGKEFSIESITYKGITTVLQITEKFITPFPNTVEMGHLQPAPLNTEQQNEISKIVVAAINAIGIDNSASHAEVMLTSQGPKMIEIGARLGGDFISSYLTKASTGISMDKASVQVALGIRPDLDSIDKAFSYIKYIDLPVGKKVKEILPTKDLYNYENLIFYHVFIGKNEIIKPITHSALRPACVLVKSDTREGAIELANKYANILYERIIVE